MPGFLKRVSFRLRPVKGVIIAALMAFAVYNTGKLWLVNITNRSIFNLIINAEPVVSDAYISFVKPGRIIASADAGRFNIKYNGIANSDELYYCDSVISSALNGGVYEGSEARDHANYINGAYINLIICEYAFGMPADLYARAYGLRSNALTSRGLQSFNSVVIETRDDETIRVSFMDEGAAYTFRLNIKNKRDIPVWRGFNGNQNTFDAFVYEYSEPDGGFALKVPETDLGRQPVSLINPYANNYGEKLIDYIHQKVEPLFQNPAAITRDIGADGVFTFSDQSAVVRYTERDVLEYHNYRATNRNLAVSFMNDFYAASTFIESDALMTNEIYLAGYEFADDFHTFWFDCVIDDIPVVLYDHKTDAGKFDHFIEVIVDHGTVIKYKKSVHGFGHAPLGSAIYLMFSDAADYSPRTKNLFTPLCFALTEKNIYDITNPGR